MVTPHPQVLDMFRLKGADYDGWIAGMRRYRHRSTADGRADATANSPRRWSAC